MMQTAPTHVTAYRRTINQEPGRHRGAEVAPLTPAERIALTIALLTGGSTSWMSLRGCPSPSVHARGVSGSSRP